MELASWLGGYLVNLSVGQSQLVEYVLVEI
jgi:hypothetical protein